jgi:putative transport protein
MAEISQFLNQEPVLLLFLIIGFGYLVGGISLGGMALGPAGGVLLVGLLGGHLGFIGSEQTQSFGFAVFIFCVGYQAGPQFFDVLMRSGLKYLSLALVVAATGVLLTIWLASLLEFAPGLAAGMMGGAMTTTPTLAAAQDAVRSGLYSVPADTTADAVLSNIGAGYAVTYLFGLVGLILIVRLLPRLLRIDLPSAAASLEASDAPGASADLSSLAQRYFRITDASGLDGTIQQLERRELGQVLVAGIVRGEEVIDIDSSTRLEDGDEILVIGTVDRLLRGDARVAVEIPSVEGLSARMTTAQIVITNPAVTGKPVRKVRLYKRSGVLPLSLRRHRTELPLSMAATLRRGDVLTVYGPETAVERLVAEVGHAERDVDATDLVTFGFGIAAGIALGVLGVSIGGITIELGTAGGLLLSGLAIGFLRSIWPVFGRVPSASLWMLMQLGLLMFVASVGLNAGGDVVEIIRSSGLALIGAGMLVTVAPTLVGYFFAVLVLRLNPAEALGGVTGAMTSGAALSIVTDAARSNVPALAYTGTYAFANVILALAGTLLMLI